MKDFSWEEGDAFAFVIFGLKFFDNKPEMTNMKLEWVQLCHTITNIGVSIMEPSPEM